MNGIINLSIPDGWVPEFAKDGVNSFLIQHADDNLSREEKDKLENSRLMDVLEKTVLPMYYKNQQQWLSILKKAAIDVVPAFESGRMAKEYYEVMYR
jgi:starch phosphorylase